MIILSTKKRAINYVFELNEESREKTELVNLSSTEWKFIDSLIDVLQLLESARKTLCADKYCTVSLVIPLITAVTVSLRKLRITNLEVKEICSNFTE